MKRLLLLAVSAALAGCATLPHSRQQLRSMAQAQQGGLGVSQATVDRAFYTVLNSLDWYVEHCLNRSVGESEVATRYHTRIAVLRDGLAELTTREARTPPQDGSPEGGRFLLAVDIEGVGAGRTRLSGYGATDGLPPRIAGAIATSGAGEQSACPLGEHGGDQFQTVATSAEPPSR